MRITSNCKPEVRLLYGKSSTVSIYFCREREVYDISKLPLDKKDGTSFTIKRGSRGEHFFSEREDEMCQFVSVGVHIHN